jgi:hypothetical protein
MKKTGMAVALTLVTALGSPAFSQQKDVFGETLKTAFAINPGRWHILFKRSNQAIFYYFLKPAHEGTNCIKLRLYDYDKRSMIEDLVEFKISDNTHRFTGHAEYNLLTGKKAASEDDLITEWEATQPPFFNMLLARVEAARGSKLLDPDGVPTR